MGILSSLLGLGKATPIQQVPQQIATPEVAKEVAPFLKDILGKGQALYKQRMGEGYVPFKEPGEYAIAPQQAEQLQAQKDILGLVGTQAPAFEEARGLVRGTTARPTAEGLQEYMSPYQQAVIDVEQRRAQEKFESDVLPKIRQAQIGAGAFGGTRGTMLEAQALADQSRLISDIESTGRHKAFTQAQTAFEAQKAREAQAAQGLTGLATGEFGAKLRELGQMEAVGREKQQLEQAKIDEDYKKFLESRAFPEQQLGTYQTLVTGASPLLGQGSVQMGPQTFNPTPIAQALGTGQQVADIYGRLTGGKAYGGQVGSGLASLPIVRRQDGGEFGSDVTYTAEGDPREMYDPTIGEHISHMDKAKMAMSPKYHNKAQEMEALMAEGAARQADLAQQEIDTAAQNQSEELLNMTNQEDLYNQLKTTSDYDIRRTKIDEADPLLKTYLAKEKEIADRRLADLDLEREERRELERSKILRGLAKGLLAPKVGRGGLWADIQAATTEGVGAMEEFEGDKAMFRKKQAELELGKSKVDFENKMKEIELAEARGNIDRQEAAELRQDATLLKQLEEIRKSEASTSRDLVLTYVEANKNMIDQKVLLPQIFNDVKNKMLSIPDLNYILAEMNLPSYEELKKDSSPLDAILGGGSLSAATGEEINPNDALFTGDIP